MRHLADRAASQPYWVKLDAHFTHERLNTASILSVRQSKKKIKIPSIVKFLEVLRFPDFLFILLFIYLFIYFFCKDQKDKETYVGVWGRRVLKSKFFLGAKP